MTIGVCYGLVALFFFPSFKCRPIKCVNSRNSQFSRLVFRNSQVKSTKAVVFYIFFFFVFSSPQASANLRIYLFCSVNQCFLKVFLCFKVRKLICLFLSVAIEIRFQPDSEQNHQKQKSFSYVSFFSRKPIFARQLVKSKIQFSSCPNLISSILVVLVYSRES